MALVDEVATVLPASDPQHTVIVVGGALLSWHGLRLSTLDVDSIEHLDATLRLAIREVATRHDLAVDWLNDRAKPWRPATFRIEDCDVLLNRPTLRVLGAPLRDVFIMKLDRGGPQDYSDLVALWPLICSSFSTARDVVETHRAAFPAALEDPYLDSSVQGIANAAGRELPLR